MAEELTDLASMVDMDNRIKWLIGDTIASSKSKIGKLRAYREAAQTLGKSQRWAFELAKVAEVFPWEARDYSIDWAVYRACAGTDEPMRWLELAKANSWSARDVRVHSGKPQARDLVEVK